MAKIPVTLEAGTADGKLAESNAIYDSIIEQFQSDINGEYKLTKQQVEFLLPIVQRLNDVQDTLTSIEADKPLSAQQGKILKDLLDTKVIEAGGVPIDTEPTEGNTTHIVTSDGIHKALAQKVNNTIFEEKNKIQDVKFSELGIYEDNPDYIRVIVDSNKKIIAGITTNGTVKILGDFEVIGGFNQLNEKVDKKEGYSLVSEDVQLDSLEDINEFVELHTDGTGKILWGITDKGEFYFGAGIPSQIKAEIQSVNNNISKDKRSEKTFTPVELSPNSFPDKLDLQYLKSLVKYKTTHHDTFCRDANASEIGNNALPGRPNVLAYNKMTNDVQVGIYAPKRNETRFNQFYRDRGVNLSYSSLDNSDPRLYDHYAGNTLNGTTKYSLYAVKGIIGDIMRVSVSRMDNIEGCDAKIAFNIKDRGNFNYISISKDRTLYGKYLDGKSYEMASYGGGTRCSIVVSGDNVGLYIDECYRTTITIESFDPNLVGLLFVGNQQSAVRMFNIDYLSKFEDNSLDNAIELGNVEEGVFGTYAGGAEIGTYSTSSLANNSRKSWRLEVNYYTREELEAHPEHLVSSSARAEIRLYPTKSLTPLDSWISSFDVFFPASGEEVYEDDELGELFWQAHHGGGLPNAPLSPYVSLNINNGVLLLSTLTRENVADNRDNVTARALNLFALSDKSKTRTGLPLLEKGKWHNFTIFVKEGYSIEHNPKTVLYVDGEKKVEWDSPNFYNHQEYAGFLNIGWYKWPWRQVVEGVLTVNPSIPSSIKKRVIYFDNVKYIN